jgi:predicted phage terminase large subunit-like protein
MELEVSRRRSRRLAQERMIHYIRKIAPWFVIEEIHLLQAGYIEALFAGIIDRLMVFMAPRSGKTMMASIFAPSQYIGIHPERKIMQASYAAELAIDWGRQVRNHVAEPEYQEMFPGTLLMPDAKASGRWNTTKGGTYYATGVTGGIAGRGFNFGVIDDPLSEQDAHSDVAKKRTHAWYGPGFYTRRQPESSIILYQGTRWAKDDLAGYLLNLPKEQSEADEWTVLKIPAIIDAETADALNEVARDPILITLDHPKRYKFKAGDSFSPRRWPKRELMRQQANMSSLDWQALYQQSPVEEAGNIFKRAWWQKWPHSEPPKCVYVLQVYDTAFEEGEENDFTARTTWGIFRMPDRNVKGTDENGDQIVVSLPPFGCILLERLNERMQFPDLRRDALDSFKLYQPDRVLVEKKASGHSLLQELRRKGVPVTGIKVDRSKRARAIATSVVLEQRCVFYMNRQWAQEVITQCADFTGIADEHDDLVDTCVYAWSWLRRMFHLQLADEPDEEDNDGVDLTPRRLYG